MPILVPPVDAPIVRPFEYRGSPFAGGLHRGVDFGAAPGTAVRAPCDGVVRHAGATPQGAAVSLTCAGRRVTLLPLTGIRVEEGELAARRDVVGVLGRAVGHAGLHLGVRRGEDRFGYVDPEALMGDPAPPLGPAPPPSPRSRPRPPRARPAPARATEPDRRTAPWPAWLGAALVLAGATGTVRFRARRTRLEHAAPAAGAGAR